MVQKSYENIYLQIFESNKEVVNKCNLASSNKLISSKNKRELFLAPDLSLSEKQMKNMRKLFTLSLENNTDEDRSC